MTAPDLAYVALAVDDPEVSAGFYEQALGLPRRDVSLEGRTVPLITAGRTAMALFARGDPFLGPDAPRGVHHMAVAAADPQAAAGETGLPVAEAPEYGLGGRRQVEIARHATCGVRVRFTEPLDPAAASSDMVQRIDHLGIASRDNAAAREIFTGPLRCVYESQQTDSEFATVSEGFVTDTESPVFHTHRSRLVASMRVTFLTVGDTELEFLQDLTTGLTADDARHDAAGNTRGDRSAIARAIASRGAGLHHIAFKTPNIAAALSALDSAGHRLIDTGGRPGSRRSLIGFLHPGATGGVLAHFVEREEV